VNEGTPAPSLIDRDLVNRDLSKLAELLVPLFLSALASLRTWRPRLGVGPFSREVPAGELLFDRLRGYLHPTISAALGSLGTLPDGELRDLCAVIASELGAWCRANPALTAEQFATAAPALAHLLGTGDSHPAPIDWSELGAALRSVSRET
jgi:hypothetical protein